VEASGVPVYLPVPEYDRSLVRLSISTAASSIAMANTHHNLIASQCDLNAPLIWLQGDGRSSIVVSLAEPCCPVALAEVLSDDKGE